MRKKFLIFFIILTFFFISSYNPRSSKNKFINIFQIKKIEIKNNKILSKDDILNEIKPIFGRSLFLFNSDELFDLISRIDFVDSAEIKKIYPSTLKITIKEKNPVAILLIDKKKYLELVRYYLKKFSIEETKETEKLALGWSIQKGSFSGRTAIQFVKSHFLDEF